MRKKQITAYSLILATNLLFGLKYFNRYTGEGILLSVLLLGLQIFLITFLPSVNFSSSKVIPKAIWIAIALLIGTLAYAHLNIDPVKLRVDRWSIIQEFFEELEKGGYPYFAHSNLNNPIAPMPFFFLLFYPFYRIGEVGILTTFGYIAFLILLQLQEKKETNSVVLILVSLLLTSLFTYWEIATRSNIFFNSVLALLALEYYYRIPKSTMTRDFYLSAIASGLVLSTRAVFIIPYIITFLSSLIRKEISIKNWVGYVFIASLSFGLTFLPLLIFFWDEFWVMNPFMVQSGVVVPFYFVISFIAMAITAAFLVKDKEDQYFFSGIILFITAAISYIYNSTGLSMKQVLLVEGADISYLIFSVPFLMFFILKASTGTQQVVTEKMRSKR